MLLISEAIDGQRQPTPGQPRDQTLAAKRTDQAIEGHGGEMVDDCAQFQTEPAMCREQGLAGRLRSHRARAQDAMRQDGKHRTTRGALETPDGDSPYTDAHGMRVARQAPAAVTGRFVPELKAQGEEKREHPFAKGFAVVTQLEVGRFIAEVGGDGTVVPRPFSCFPQVLPPDHQVSEADETPWRQHIATSR
jgi:hypothetical protein